jgi:hypothetical protein
MECAFETPMFADEGHAMSGLNLELQRRASRFGSGFDVLAKGSCAWKVGFVAASRRFVSVMAEYDYYVEGTPHPTDGVEGFVWDINADRVLTTSELLILGADSGQTSWNQLLSKAHPAVRTSVPDIADQAFSEPGLDGQGLSVVPAAKGVRVGFSRCDLIGCAMHSVIVEIPFADLKGILRPEIVPLASEPFEESGWLNP